MAKNTQNNRKGSNIEEPRINDEIFGYKEVRVVYRKSAIEKSDEDFSRVMNLYEAKNLSRQMGLDLIEINATANPPVVKLEDYSKYLYELKKAQKAKSKVTNEMKELQLSVNISQHDLEIKANKAKEFLSDGNKVKVVLTMKRRELERREESEKSLYQFIMLCEECGVPESMPRQETTKTLVILKKKKQN